MPQPMCAYPAMCGSVAESFVKEAKEKARSLVHTLEDPKVAEDAAGRGAHNAAKTARVTRDITVQAAQQARP